LPKLITAHAFWQALVAAGVFHEDEGDKVRRVVIDANVGDAVVVYVERWADERLLSVATTLEGIQVRGVSAE
jgi:hypothetical protein